LSTGELTRLVREDEAARLRVGRRVAKSVPSADEEVKRALGLVRAVSAQGLDSMLRRTVANLGVPVFLDVLAAPLLRRMGEERRAGRLTLAQEHLATAIIQRVLEGAIHFLVAPHDAPSLLLTTLTGERHTIGAVLAATAAAAEGWRVTNLGPDLPAGEIASAAIAASARVVGVSVVNLAERKRVLKELRTLRSRLPASVPLLAVGAGAVALAPELRAASIHVVSDLSALRAALWSANGRGKT
jgi:methylmalonyl-CoA mutase cobalamin-binding subunit